MCKYPDLMHEVAEAAEVGEGLDPEVFVELHPHAYRAAAEHHEGCFEPAPMMTGWPGTGRRDGRASGPAAASNSRDVPALFAVLCFIQFAYKYLYIIFILHTLYYQGITEALIV